MLVGELDVELMFQGMMIECIWVGGAGIGVFYILIGVGIEVVEGKEECVFDGKCYILE